MMQTEELEPKAPSNVPDENDFVESRMPKFRLDGKEGAFIRWETVNNQPVEAERVDRFIGIVHKVTWLLNYTCKFTGEERSHFDLHLESKQRGRFVLRVSPYTWTGLKLIGPLTLATRSKELILQVEIVRSEKRNKHGGIVFYINVYEKKADGNVIELRFTDDKGSGIEEILEACLEDLERHPLYEKTQPYKDGEDEPAHPYEGLNSKLIAAGALPIYGNEGLYLAVANKAAKAQWKSLAEVQDWPGLGEQMLKAFQAGKLPSLKPSDEFDPFADE